MFAELLNRFAKFRKSEKTDENKPYMYKEVHEFRDIIETNVYKHVTDTKQTEKTVGHKTVKNFQKITETENPKKDEEEAAKTILKKGYYSKSNNWITIVVGAALIIVFAFLVLWAPDYRQSKFFRDMVAAIAALTAAVSAWCDWTIRDMKNTIEVKLDDEEAEACKKTNVYRNKLGFFENLRALLIIVAFMAALLVL